MIEEKGRATFSLFGKEGTKVPPVTGSETETGLGRLILSDEAIATIAGAAATECYGVVGMASRKMADGISELLGRENLSKGVSVSIEGDSVYVDLVIVVGYGVRISEVARMVVDKVRYTLQNATGLTVKKVTVNVQGVRMQGSFES